MSDSRIAPWLSESRWPTAPIRLVARLGSGHTPSRSKPEYWQNCTTPWITLADVWQLRSGQKSTITETKEKISSLGEANSAAVKHPAGTVILSRTASVGFSAIMGRDMATSQDFATWTCGPRLEPRYLLHALRGMAPDLKRIATGSTHKTIYMPDIEQLRVPLPPLDEQRRISDFLDAETTRIDDLVAALQRELDLLAEHRSGGVTAAVSGYTHKDRRSSTLAWLESIPATWQEVRIGLLARMGSGHTPSRSRPEWWTDCTIPWITTGEVKQVRNDRIEDLYETREKISHLGLSNSSAELHPKGTVFLCRTASAGYSGIMGHDMATSQDFVTWTCGRLLSPYFLLWCLRAMRSDLLGRLAMGSTHKTIYVPDLQMIRIPVPPIEEQLEIVHVIRNQNARIDALTDKVRIQQDLLRERRHAIVTAAVTGQFDVSTASGRNTTEGVTV